jgi:hypothetical protein
MKNVFKTLVVALTALALVSCGGAPSTSNHAESVCSCMNEAGLEDISMSKVMDYRYMRDMENNAEEKLPPCLLKVVKAMAEDLDGLSKNDQTAYTKSFLKDCIDTDCSDQIIGLVPFDMMGLAIGQLEREVNR